MADNTIPRRGFLSGAAGAAAGATLVAGLPQAQAQAQTAQAAEGAAMAEAPLTLNPTEMAFVTAAVDTLIPADELTPKGSDCGIDVFIDRQLASAWGGGAKLYRAGPYLKGKPENGYQLPLTPREFFAAGIAATNAWTVKTIGKEFDRLDDAQRVEVLKTLEGGKAELGDVGAKPFFEALLGLTIEGLLSDPMYGGNRGKIGWKMVGFPGLPALYTDKIVAYRGKRYDAEPQSIADFS